MQFFLNYILYSTWRLLILLGEVLWVRPFTYIINFFPYLGKRWKKGLPYFRNFNYNNEYGKDILFAKYIIFWPILLIYFQIGLYVKYLFDITFPKKNYYILFIALIIIAITSTYFLFYHNDIYLEYFKKFEERYRNRMNYIWALLFYLGVLILTVFSIHWTIGFNF